MIELDKIIFTQRIISGRLYLKGTLNMGCETSVPVIEIEQAKFDAKEEARRTIRHFLWERAYKELFNPVEMLLRHAKLNTDFQTFQNVERLTTEIRELLFPKI